MPISVKDGGRFSPYTSDPLLVTPGLTPVLAEETENSSQSQLFHLISLQLPHDSTWVPANDATHFSGGAWWFQIADSNYDLHFNGQKYTSFPAKFNGASISSDGTIDKATVQVANVSREIMDEVETNNGLRNMRVKVKTVYAKFLDNTYTPQADGSVVVTDNTGTGGTANNTAYIEDEYFIDTYAANEQLVTFQLDPIIDMEIKLPRRRYMQDSCYFVYKDANTCRYPVDGPLDRCAKNLDDCRNHSNEDNFGGFPGISASRRIIL